MIEERQLWAPFGIGQHPDRFYKSITMAISPILYLHSFACSDHFLTPLERRL